MENTKTSIRFFDEIPIRSAWDEETSKWWICAMDVVGAIVETSNPRVYWATIKRRNVELFANCKQLKRILFSLCYLVVRYHGQTKKT